MNERNNRYIEGMAVIERGFFHGNVIAFWKERLELVDTGYCTGVAELSDCVEKISGRAMEDLSRIILTHAHSDHTGGVAVYKVLSGCEVLASEGVKKLTEPWDATGLWIKGMNQELPIFQVDKLIAPGEQIEMGGVQWEIFAAPGHATGGIGFFQPETGVLIAGDALWEDGFGILNPSIDGEQVFEEAREALDTIESLQPSVVIPGHGRPFRNVGDALTRARGRLEHMLKNPTSALKVGVRGGLGFWILSHGEVNTEELHRFLLHVDKHLPEWISSLGLSAKEPEAFSKWLIATGTLVEDNGIWSPGKALDGMNYPPKVTHFG